MNGTITHLMEVAETLMTVKAEYTWYPSGIRRLVVTDEDDEPLDLEPAERSRLINEINRKHRGVAV